MMIDYEKLNEAQKLIKNLSSKGWYFKQYIRRFFAETDVIENESYLLAHPEEYNEEFKSLDDLLQKLRELTELEPKYKEAWYLGKESRLPKCTLVKDDTGYQSCDKTDIESLGRYMYDSKAELIQAQIEYWTLQKNLEIKGFGEDTAKLHWQSGVCLTGWENIKFPRTENLYKKPPEFECETKGFGEDTDYHAPKITDVGSECNLPATGDIPAKGTGTIEIRSGLSNQECEQFYNDH